MTLGLFSGLINAGALDFYKYKVYRLVRIPQFEPNCVVLAPQLSSVFSTQSFVTVQKQAEYATKLLQQIKESVEATFEKLARVELNLEKRDIALKLLYRIRQNLNYSAMEAWQHTGVGIYDLICRDKEVFEEERGLELNRLLYKEDDTMAVVRYQLADVRAWFERFQK